VTPAAIEQAVRRTSAPYLGDLRTMLAEVGKVYEGQLAAQDAALAAKDQTLAAHALTIAPLRRRAEVAEAQLQRRIEAEQVQAASRGSDAGGAGGPRGTGSSRRGTRRRSRVWGRLRRWWGARG